MNNSLERIYEAMSAALRRDIVPNLGDPHARRQAVAMIDLLNHLRLKTEWSPLPIRETVCSQIVALRRLEALFEGSPMKPPVGSPAPAPQSGHSVSELVAMRDELDETVSGILVWLDRRRDELGEERAGAAEAVLNELIGERLRAELRLSPKPLFGEM
jgi:hypothetical protein